MREEHSYVKNKSSSQCYLKEGDVVLIKENNSTPWLSWKKGVIEKLIIGNGKNVRGASVRTTYGKSTKTIVLNRPLQLLIPLELSSSENVETIKKDKNELLQKIIEKHCDFTLVENIENRRSIRLAAKNANVMNKLMFGQ